MCTLSEIKKIRVQTLHHAVLVVVLLVLLNLALGSSPLREVEVLRMFGTTVYASGNLTPNELMHVHRLGEGRLH